MDKKNTYETKQLEFSGIKRNIKVEMLLGIKLSSNMF